MDTVSISSADRTAYLERRGEVWALATHLFREWATDQLLVDDSVTRDHSLLFIRASRVFVDEFQNLLPDIPPPTTEF